MKRFALAVAVVASLTLLTSCSADADEPAEPAASAASEPTDAPSEPAAAASGAAGEATVLIGSVGTPEDPEAFKISLTDESGVPVTTLPAGDYSVQVSDPATMHNFHLIGGAIDETTSVPETVETTFEVTLEAGEYTYKCDPHQPMTGTFTVS